MLVRQINGGLLGTLAAIGIPMAIGVKPFWKRNLFDPKKGKGLQVPKRYGK